MVASHVIDLHKRSRSPRNGRRRSGDEHLEDINRSDPASQLGTFSNITGPRPGGADSSGQEAPWRIGLPNSEEEENKRNSPATSLGPQSAPRTTSEGETTPTKAPRRAATESVPPRKAEENGPKQGQATHEPTIAERVMGVQLARGPLPVQRSMSAGNATARPSQKSPVELPGSRALNYDSDEEIVMSSTAYPGQEWAPEYLGYGGNWDD
jgi:hypothetical protein